MVGVLVFADVQPELKRSNVQAGEFKFAHDAWFFACDGGAAALLGSSVHVALLNSSMSG